MNKVQVNPNYQIKLFFKTFTSSKSLSETGIIYE